jgi:hypothetical protein
MIVLSGAGAINVFRKLGRENSLDRLWPWPVRKAKSHRQACVIFVSLSFELIKKK